MPRQRDPYPIFSQVYDQDVHLDVPRELFRTLRPWLRAARGGPPVLDLGCGSGLLTARIAAAGVDVVGVDRSRAMLRRARQRCGADAHVKLRARDIADLRLPPVHTLAIACHDVLNHVPSEVALRRVLASVRHALAPGGVLVFDALTPWAFETYWPDNTHRLTGPYGDLWMDCDWEPERRRGCIHMTAYVRDTRGRYRRHEMKLHEYAWDDAAFARTLREAGFDEVWRRPWSAWPEPGERPERALWCGRRTGEGPVGLPALRALGFRRVKGAKLTRPEPPAPSPRAARAGRACGGTPPSRGPRAGAPPPLRRSR
jgi:SAM-dependent methyltransferase